MIRKFLTASVVLLILSSYSFSQNPPFTYSNPEEYSIKGITVSGIQFFDPTVIVSISGLYVGDTISFW